MQDYRTDALEKLATVTGYVPPIQPPAVRVLAPPDRTMIRRGTDKLSYSGIPSKGPNYGGFWNDESARGLHGAIQHYRSLFPGSGMQGFPDYMYLLEHETDKNGNENPLYDPEKFNYAKALYYTYNKADPQERAAFSHFVAGDTPLDQIAEDVGGKTRDFGRNYTNAARASREALDRSPWFSKSKNGAFGYTNWKHLDTPVSKLFNGGAFADTEKFSGRPGGDRSFAPMFLPFWTFKGNLGQVHATREESTLHPFNHASERFSELEDSLPFGGGSHPADSAQKFINDNLRHPTYELGDNGMYELGDPQEFYRGMAALKRAVMRQRMRTTDADRSYSMLSDADRERYMAKHLNPVVSRDASNLWSSMTGVHNAWNPDGTWHPVVTGGVRDPRSIAAGLIGNAAYDDEQVKSIMAAADIIRKNYVAPEHRKNDPRWTAKDPKSKSWRALQNDMDRYIINFGNTPTDDGKKGTRPLVPNKENGAFYDNDEGRYINLMDGLVRNGGVGYSNMA